MEKIYNLPGVAEYLGVPIGDVIQYGGAGELTIYVIADEWPGKVVDGKNAGEDITADGQVALQPDDVLKSLDKDHVQVRTVRTINGDLVKLDTPREVFRGAQYVTADERRRFQKTLRPMLAAHGDTLPPYMDSSHKYYSWTLAASVRAWYALFDDGELTDGSPVCPQIRAWLKRNFGEQSSNARDCITTVVNPNKSKGGGGQKKN